MHEAVGSSPSSPTIRKSPLLTRGSSFFMYEVHSGYMHNDIRMGHLNKNTASE